MKFSFNLIKKFAPGKYSKQELIEKLSLYSFEAADLGGDCLEIAVTPNRYSDAASHLGIAREAAAVMNLKLSDPTARAFKADTKEKGKFTVNIIEEKSRRKVGTPTGASGLCRRYMAAYVANIKVGSSPVWLKEALENCGLRSINNVVDVMNYVMLELGQPLHAFDADKLSGGIVVRTAKKGESLTTIDNQKLQFTPEVLVIADKKSPQAVAGIKGGKPSEVSAKTKNILVEAASFDGASIYRSSRLLGLATDASQRFAHDLSPELVSVAMARTLQLIKEVTGGQVHTPIDVYPKKQSRKLIKFDIDKINALLGYEFDAKEALKKLQTLGFSKASAQMIEVSPLRIDVQNIEDVAEEVARLYGLNNLPAVAPTVALAAAEQEDQITLKDRARALLIGAGLTEVYNYSFLAKPEVGENAVELANPISSQFGFLRDSLKRGLLKNLESNSRFFDAVRVFEIGKVFARSSPTKDLVGDKGSDTLERLMLGFAVYSPESHLELKGIIDSLFGGLGITDYDEAEESLQKMRYIVDGRDVGYLEFAGDVRNSAVAEFNLEELVKLTAEEREYKPLSKYPAVTRDLSIWVTDKVRVGLLLDQIQRVNPRLINDVDLIDFYEPEPAIHPKRDRSAELESRRKSLTFRIVFQAEDRTLTDAEVDREMAIVNQILIDKFNVELR